MVVEKLEISNAEWEVMRLLWTLNSATSAKLISILSEKFDWKPATVKTLLHRLLDKKIVHVKKNGRSFIYYPNVPEQETIDQQLMIAVSKICQMHVGETINNVIQQVPLTKKDIEKIESTLIKKKKNAPISLKCDCLPKNS